MRIGVTITKDTLFRGVQQEFHNTYHFTLGTAITAPSEAIIDELVTSEKKLHSLNVNFKRAQVWSAGGTKAQNQMLFQKNLTGTGAGGTDASMDKERAVLVQWKAGFDTRGKQVYLRKWYHSCGNPVGTTMAGTTGVLANTAAISDANRATIAAAAEETAEVGTGDFWSLCAASGREATDPATCHKYLEHHQLGDMWR
jgi:hypothetical protein